MEKSISVDKNKCIHCGMCIKDCMMSAIEFDENKIPHYGNGGKGRCLSCQHCMAICPVGALSFGNKNPSESANITYGNSEEILNIIKSRRSVRLFKNEDIPAEKFEKISEMLAYPPTGGNADTLHFSIVKTKESMEEIRKLSYEKIVNDSSDSPLVQFCKNAYQNGQDILYRGAPSMVVASVNKSKVAAGCETVDPIIALSYLELYTWSLGLGTLWDDAAVFTASLYPEVMSRLNIPEGYSLSFILLLGIPSIKYKRAVQKDTTNVSFI